MDTTLQLAARHLEPSPTVPLQAVGFVSLSLDSWQCILLSALSLYIQVAESHLFGLLTLRAPVEKDFEAAVIRRIWLQRQ